MESDIYNGELYDAGLEMDNWTVTGFNENGWKDVAILDHPKDKLVAPQGVPVKAIEEIEPIELITTPLGETVMDMGQNMVGWIRIKLKGNKMKIIPSDYKLITEHTCLDADIKTIYSKI